MENPELFKAIKSLPDCLTKYLGSKEKIEESSALSIVKKITKAQEYWGLFIALVNYQIKVRLYLVPMLDAIAEEIKNTYNGDFLLFLYDSPQNQKLLFEKIIWHYINSKGKEIKRTGWSHHRLVKIKDLLCILTKLKEHHENNGSLGEFTKRIYQKSQNFEKFLSKFVNSFWDRKLCGSCTQCSNDEEICQMTKKHIGLSTIRKTACFKRYLLYFRWMDGW